MASNKAIESGGYNTVAGGQSFFVVAEGSSWELSPLMTFVDSDLPHVEAATNDLAEPRVEVTIEGVGYIKDDAARRRFLLGVEESLLALQATARVAQGSHAQPPLPKNCNQES